MRSLDRVEQGREGEQRCEALALQLPLKPSSSRYASLDAWRGAACLMLLMYHATFYADLSFRTSDPSNWSLAGLVLALVRKFWVGVPMFFVISGYCISASVDSLRRRPYSLSVYFSRRFRRIYPPLWTMCVITVLLILSLQSLPAVASHCRQLPSVRELSLWSWLGNLAAAETWRHNVFGDEPRYLIGNTWTLCYEEQFYVATGIMLLITTKRFFLMAAITTGLVVIAHHGLRLLGIGQEGFFWDGHWVLFAVGILVYHALNYQAQRQRWWTYITLSVGMLYGSAGRIAGTDPTQQHLSKYMFVSAVFGLGLIWLRKWDEIVACHWTLSPFVWCGKRSYSIYLTHYPLVVFASSTAAMAGLTSEASVLVLVVPASLLLSLPVAWLFNLTVERRFLNIPENERLSAS